MARTPGATADNSQSIRDYLADRLDEYPCIPAGLIVPEIRQTFGIGRSQAYAYLKEAKAARAAERPQTTDWQVHLAQRRQTLEEYKESMQARLYEAERSGNLSVAAGLYRQLIALEDKLAALAPSETFRSQFEHLAAVDRVPF